MGRWGGTWSPRAPMPFAGRPRPLGRWIPGVRGVPPGGPWRPAVVVCRHAPPIRRVIALLAALLPRVLHGPCARASTSWAAAPLGRGRSGSNAHRLAAHYGAVAGICWLRAR